MQLTRQDNQPVLVAAKQQETASESPIAVNSTNVPMAFVVSFVATLGIFAISIRKSSRTVWVKRKSVQAIPCHRCKFFNDNPHLKCTVNPNVVLRDQAVNCRDYCP